MLVTAGDRASFWCDSKSPLLCYRCKQFRALIIHSGVLRQLKIRTKWHIYDVSGGLASLSVVLVE